MPESEENTDPADPVEITPIWREPPPPPEIPAVLREPAHPARSTGKGPGESAKSEILGMGRAWGLALDFVFTVLAGAGLGWVGGRYVGPMPAWVMAGLALGFVIGFTRIIRSTLREEREAEGQKKNRPR